MTAVQIDRFVLRELNPWDGPKLFALTGDPVITKYLGFRTHQSVDDATRLIELYNKSPSIFQAVYFDDDADIMLGVIGMEVQKHATTLTIMFRHGWSYRGVSRRVCVPLVKWIFTHPRIWRVHASCHVDNVPAQRVLERMHAVREGRLRRFDFFPNISSEPQDCLLYSIVR